MSSTQIKREILRKKMTETKNKYIKIKQITDAHDHQECPYCFGPVTDFFDGKKLRRGCKNCDIVVRDTDYFNAVRYIVRYGDYKPENKYKKLGEF